MDNSILNATKGFTKFFLTPLLFCTAGCVPGANSSPKPAPSAYSGNGFFNKRSLLDASRSTTTQSPLISQLQYIGGDQGVLAYVANDELRMIDSGSGELKNRIPLDLTSPRMLFQNVCNDERPETILGGRGFADVGLLDAGGNVMWRRTGGGRGPGVVQSLAAGDLNLDGEMEFYLATRDGLECLDVHGRQKWKRAIGTWVNSVEVLVASETVVGAVIAKTTPKGAAGSRFDLYNHEGEKTGGFQLPVSSGAGFRCIRISRNSDWIIVRGNRELIVTDTKGHVAFEVSSPGDWPPIFSFEAVALHVGRPSLALLLKFRKSYFKGTLFMVVDLDGKVLYRESLPHRSSFAVLPGLPGSPDTVVVSPGGRALVEYSRAR